MKHYLISIHIEMPGEHRPGAHAYVISDDTDIAAKVANKMITLIEEAGFFIPVTVFLTTILEDPSRVREYVNEICPESVETMATMDNFHITMWSGSTPEWLWNIH